MKWDLIRFGLVCHRDGELWQRQMTEKAQILENQECMLGTRSDLFACGGESVRCSWKGKPSSHWGLSESLG